ncbi:unnamed protein product, partial [Amoebophrya sp. A25]
AEWILWTSSSSTGVEDESVEAQYKYYIISNVQKRLIFEILLRQRSGTIQIEIVQDNAADIMLQSNDVTSRWSLELLTSIRTGRRSPKAALKKLQLTNPNEDELSGDPVVVLPGGQGEDYSLKEAGNQGWETDLSKVLAQAS